MTMTVLRVNPSDPQFAAVTVLFDAYRQHYGANPAPEATEAWLRAQADAGRMQVFAAVADVEPVGILTVCVLPASLTLRTWWSVRDVYVAPQARRNGAARALLAHVADAARAAGAHRLSLQTEIDNPARALYAGLGFQPVTGLAQLSLTL